MHANSMAHCRGVLPAARRGDLQGKISLQVGINRKADGRRAAGTNPQANLRVGPQVGARRRTFWGRVHVAARCGCAAGSRRWSFWGRMRRADSLRARGDGRFRGECVFLEKCWSKRQQVYAVPDGAQHPVPDPSRKVPGRRHADWNGSRTGRGRRRQGAPRRTHSLAK